MFLDCQRFLSDQMCRKEWLVSLMLVAYEIDVCSLMPIYEKSMK